jgi:predicted nucleic acid-binding protein
LTKEIVDAFQSGMFNAFSSVITLTEVLPKPIENRDERLAKKFVEFLRRGKNFTLIEISEAIGESAGKLRGRYPFLRTIDALQVAAAINVGVDVFLTNDLKLKQLEEVKILALKDYL